MTQASTPSSSSSTSSLTSTLAGMGLFLATAGVSQWIQIHHQSKLNQQKRESDRRYYNDRRRRRRRDASRSTTTYDDDSYEFDGNQEHIKERIAFRRRQLSRRLSFQQFDDDDNERKSPRAHNPSPGDNEERLKDNHRSRSSRRRQQQQQRGSFAEWSIHNSTNDLTALSEQTKEGSRTKESIRFSRDRGSFKSPVVNNRYHDFHPKHQNWRHLEHSSVYDKARQKKNNKKTRLSERRHQEQQREHREQQQQEQQQKQRPCQQQHAGEGASQNKDDETKLSAIPMPQHRCNQLHNQSMIDNGSDQESFFTFDDENSDNDRSATSFGSGGNEYVWTGNESSRYHPDESSKSIFSFGSYNNRNAEPRDKNRRGMTLYSSDPFDINSERLSNRCGDIETRDIITTEGSGRSIYANDTNADNRMGKFQRFYQMLTSSIIDDSEDHAEGSNSSREIYISSSTSDGSSSIDYDGDVEDRHRALRTEYNAQIMPEKLVLIRHGQSMGNVDETFYATTPDNAMPLTDLGWEQAKKAGTILKDKIINQGESVHFIVSPYVRTVETFHGIVSAWCDPESEEFASIEDRNRKVNAWYERLTELGLTWNEDSRIREQDFGNYQTPEVTKRAKEERHRFGAFYYRFNNGESGSDVFDRVSTFLDSLWRSFETNKSQNYVLVTHGIVLRVLMARYFRYTISQLNMLANPRNCEMVVLGHAGNGKLDLEGRCSLELEEDPEMRQTKVKGYRFHKRLRILPKSHIRTVQFRISPLDRKV